MKKKKRVVRPRLEDLIPDDDRRKEIVSRLYNGDPIVGEDGIFTDLLQALVNASLEGEMDQHLQEDSQQGKSNRRNGHMEKTVRSRVGPMQVVTPRDRDGSHDPQLIKKWERELNGGMDHVILSLYARGQSVDDVRHQLRELYGLEVSAGTISAVTDRVWDEIISWQQRHCLFGCNTF
jgi:transposase-like protein